MPPLSDSGSEEVSWSAAGSEGMPRSIAGSWTVAGSGLETLTWIELGGLSCISS